MNVYSHNAHESMLRDYSSNIMVLQFKLVTMSIDNNSVIESKTCVLVLDFQSVKWTICHVIHDLTRKQTIKSKRKNILLFDQN